MKKSLEDIRIQLTHHELRPVYKTAERLRHIPQNEPPLRKATDFGVVQGDDNLAQAMIMRLLTPMGELAPLGHPEYGSRLHELIGQLNTETTRNLVKLYIIESLQREPRIAQIQNVIVNPHPQYPMGVEASLEVIPRESTTVITIGPFLLRLAS